LSAALDLVFAFLELKFRSKINGKTSAQEFPPNAVVSDLHFSSKQLHLQDVTVDSQ